MATDPPKTPTHRSLSPRLDGKTEKDKDKNDLNLHRGTITTLSGKKKTE